MNNNSKATARFAFLHQIIIEPSLARRHNLFWSYSFIETLGWLKLAFDCGYIQSEQLAAFVETQQEQLANVLSLIRYKDFRRDLSGWNNILTFTESEAGIAAEIDKNKLLERSGEFLTNGYFQEEEAAVHAEFQNLILLSFETSLAEPTASLLTELNFATNERWRRLLAGDGENISLRYLAVGAATVLQLLDDYPWVPPRAEDETARLMRRVKLVQHWKLNFASAALAKRFYDVAQLIEGVHHFSLADQKEKQLVSRNVILTMENWIGRIPTTHDREIFEEPSDEWHSDNEVLTSSAYGLRVLGLSLPTTYFLTRVRILSVDDLIKKRAEDLLSTGAIDLKMLEEITSTLAKHNLRLKAMYERERERRQENS